MQVWLLTSKQPMHVRLNFTKTNRHRNQSTKCFHTVGSQPPRSVGACGAVEPAAHRPKSLEYAFKELIGQLHQDHEAYVGVMRTPLPPKFVCNISSPC